MAALHDLLDGMRGVIFPFGGTVAPASFLMCDGSAVSRTTYAALFATIGTTFGTGDGSTTFNVPDMRGRVAAGKDDMGGVAAKRMNTTANVSTTSGSNVVTYSGQVGVFNVGMRVFGSGVPANTTITVISTSGLQLTLSNNATATASNVPMRFGIVDGATLGDVGGAQNHVLLPAQMPVHTHTAIAAAPTTLVAGNTFVRNTNTSSAQIQTDSAGSDQSHPNVQPTMIMNYIIKT